MWLIEACDGYVIIRTDDRNYVGDTPKLQKDARPAVFESTSIQSNIRRLSLAADDVASCIRRPFAQTVLVTAGSGWIRQGGDDELPLMEGDVTAIPADATADIGAAPGERLKLMIIDASPASH